MLLTISTTHQPATDLGFLLHKNPDGVHTAALSFGNVHVVYPEAGNDRATAALLVEVDPVQLVRGRSKNAPKGNEFSLAHYVNDRPYAASSFLSVAINKAFGTAMTGRSKERQALADADIPLTIHLPVAPCRGGEAVLRNLFEPLGYTVTTNTIPLDPAFPQWGDSRYLDVTLEATTRLQHALEHLFVLLPVLDDDKHYWVGPEEVDKLLRRGGTWLGSHPHKELIARRYLRHDRRLTLDAMARLLADEPDDPDEQEAAHDAEEAQVEKPLSLNEQRLNAVVDQVVQANARRVVDLGCGSGNLVRRLLKQTHAEHVLGIDVSHRALALAARRLHLDTMAPRQRERVELAQGSLTYRDKRLQGFDAATVVEVIEHLDPPRLGAFERVLFLHARPTRVIVTTPNVEYNALFEGLPAHSLRHRDHRFEWTRAEFADWAATTAERNGYTVAIHPIGPVHEDHGPPTQMAVFTR